MTTFLLRSRPTTTPAMLAVFGDAATVRSALAFEAALATAQADVGLLPASTAARIEAACGSLAIDIAALADEAALAGTLAIPLVAHLRQALAAWPETAQAVHKGATSQDLADTVLMIQVRDGAALITADLQRIEAALTLLAHRYAATPALGRTLLQDAAPISFGLRIANWFAGIADARQQLATACTDGIALQFGGAVGTRAGLDGHGAELASLVANRLGLGTAAPWHGRRSGIAAIAASAAIVVGALGKMARDVSLLAQNAIGEAREPLIAGRGGSSAMAHKRNPTGCQITLSAAQRAPGLVAGILSGLPQEEERGLGGWQAEAPAMAELMLLAAGAADAMAAVAEGLDIDDTAIARNLAAAGVGADIGEAPAIVADLLQTYGSNA